MPNRITGLNSGLDTESLVMSLTQKDQKKVDDLSGTQKRLSWKQDAWKSLNSDIVSFYNGSNERLSYMSAFSKKVTTSSNAGAVSIVTGSDAMNATQKMKVNKLATTAYITGGKVKTTSGDKATGSTKLSDLGVKFSTKTSERQEKVPVMVDDTDKPIYETDANGEFVLNDEGEKIVTGYEQKQATDENGALLWEKDAEGNEITNTVTETRSVATLKVNGQEMEFGENATINDVLNAIKNGSPGGQKLNANFDATNGRIYMAAASSGEKGNFTIDGDTELLNALGLNQNDTDPTRKAVFEAGTDAEIELNGVKYQSDNGTFEINGLTITANEVTDSEFTISTKQDTSGIYDMVKDFLKEYNTLINQMDTKYTADAARKYTMLTDDEKEAMSEKEVEEWEKKIKDGLLSRDQTLYDVSYAMKQVMGDSYDVKLKDGSTRSMALSDFGINTLSYFSAKAGERNAYHIDGDKDDTNTKSNEDQLSKWIASDPDAVAGFFSQLNKTLHSKLFDLMKGTEYSSSFTVYEDKLMASQYSDYTTKIKTATDYLNSKQDKYYSKFAKMEAAMSKVNATQSQMSSYFG